MTTRLILLLALTLLATGFRVVGNRAPLSVRYMIEQGSTLSIQGTTNINTFECISRQSFGQQAVTLTTDPTTRSISFDHAILNLRVKELNCDNNKIDADLCDALKADQFPNITIELLDARLPKSDLDDDWTDITIVATLKITDQKRRIELRAKGKLISDGRYRFVAAKALKMSDYGVDPPTALFGLIKVKDEITINFNLITRVNTAG